MIKNNKKNKLNEQVFAGIGASETRTGKRLAPGKAEANGWSRRVSWDPEVRERVQKESFFNTRNGVVCRKKQMQQRVQSIYPCRPGEGGGM